MLIAAPLEMVGLLIRQLILAIRAADGRRLGRLLRDKVDHLGLDRLPIPRVRRRVGELAMLLVASLVLLVAAVLFEPLELLPHDVVEADALQLEVVLDTEGVVKVGALEADPAALWLFISTLLDNLDLVGILKL